MPPDEIAARLSDAGRILLALPTVDAITPEQRAGWPEMVSRAVDALGRGDQRYRHGVRLTRADVARMAEALGLLAHVTDQKVQRVVFLRALTHPGRETPLHSWREIGAMLAVSGTAVQKWHCRGVEEIAEALAQAGQV